MTIRGHGRDMDNNRSNLYILRHVNSSTHQVARVEAIGLINRNKLFLHISLSNCQNQLRKRVILMSDMVKRWLQIRLRYGSMVRFHIYINIDKCAHWDRLCLSKTTQFLKVFCLENRSFLTCFTTFFPCSMVSGNCNWNKTLLESGHN